MMISGRLVAVWVILAAALVLPWLQRLVGSEDAAPAQADRTDFARLLAAWKRASANAIAGDRLPRGPVSLPGDHGVHVAAPAEHWDFLLRVASGARIFTFRVSIARLGAAPMERASRWGASQFFRSLVTMIDSRDGSYRRHERYARNALDLGGFDLNPPRIHVGGNYLEWSVGTENRGGALLTIRESGITADLRVRAAKSARNWGQGQASGSGWRGYMVPRAIVEGTVAVHSVPLTVQGDAWYSHIWGDLPPVGGQIAFDRWTLLFDDDTELVLLHLRRRIWSAAGAIEGMHFAADGSDARLNPGSVELKPVTLQGGYPIEWRLRIADQAIDLKLASTARGEGAQSRREGEDVAIEIERTGDAGRRVGWGFLEPDGY